MKLSVFATVALLCACTAVSAKNYVPPTPIAAQLPIEVIFSQQEILIDTPDNSGLASQGLIGAIIGAVVSNQQAKTAEKRAALVRNLLLDFRFHEHMEAAIRAKIANEAISPFPQIVVRDSPWDFYSANTQDGLQKAVADGNKPPTGLLLSLVPSYALSYGLQVIHVGINARLINRSLNASGKYKDKSIWQRSYCFSFPLPVNPDAKPETNVARWTAIGGPELQRKLELGVEQVTDMLVYDFSTEGRAEGALKVTRKDSSQFKGQVVYGRRLRTGDDWYWTRVGKGYLMAINGTQPLEEPPAPETSVPSGTGSQ